MTTPAHGSVPDMYLASIGGGLFAERNTAAAFKALQAAHPEVHTNGAASGYWSHALSVNIHEHPGTFNISASEAKALALVGASPHELGTRLNFSGCTTVVAAQFGFVPYRNTYTWDYTGELSWNEPLPGQRIAKAAGGNVRATPSATGLKVGNYQGNQLCTFTAYTLGDTVTQNGITTNVWYIGGNAGKGDAYFWAGGFTDDSTNGLTLATVALDSPPAQPTPPPTTTPATPPTPVSPPPPPAEPTTPKAPTMAQEQWDAKYAEQIAALKEDAANLNSSVTGAPLAGLFAGHTKGRKRAYAAYAGAALLVSFGPDLVTYQIISGIHVAALTAWIGFVSSAMLKIGAAFGFVASANTKD